MPQSQQLTVELRRESESSDRWPIPLADWPGLHIGEITDVNGKKITAFTQQDGKVIYRSPQPLDRLFATVELERPAKDLEEAKLEFEREKATSEDKWRARTYAFTIGSAILTALVTLGVALIARPSHASTPINVDAVHACRDSVQRLSTLTQLQGQTLQGLSAAVSNHTLTCDPVLLGLIEAAAKSDGK
jgi:hypothetical protein